MDRCIADLKHIIDQKAERDRKARMTEEEREKEQWNGAYNKVVKLNERISNLIELANYSESKGMSIPDSGKKYGYDAAFFAEGIHHHVGLYRNGTTDITHLAIINGGAFGPIDVIVGQGSIRAKKGKETEPIVNISTRDLDKFYTEFIKFERAFYKWIESLQEE